MGKATQVKQKASNISSTANPADTAVPNATKSSLLKSSFCPSRYQLSLFASVIRGLDAEQLRIHNTRTGRVQCIHSLGPRASVTTLEWGYYDQDAATAQSQDGTKKRKRLHQAPMAPSSEQMALAVGTSESEIHLYSSTEARVLGTLKNAHTNGIKDFKFVEHQPEALAWSIGGDSKLVQWDVQRRVPLRAISLPSESIETLGIAGSLVLCASHMAYAFDSQTGKEIGRFSASTNAVRLFLHHEATSAKQQRFLTAAQNDRFLNLFEPQVNSAIGSLCTEGEVIQADFALSDPSPSPQDVSLVNGDGSSTSGGLLAIVNQQGVLEIFTDPFQFGFSDTSGAANDIKARMRQRTRRSNAQVHFTGDAHQMPIPVVNVSIEGIQLVVAWVRGGVNVLFESIIWQDESNGALRFRGNALYELSKDKIGVVAAVNGDTKMQHSQLDESHAVVTNGVSDHLAAGGEDLAEVISISSGEDQSDSENDDEARSDPRQSTNTTSLLESREEPDSMDLVKQITGNGQTADDVHRIPHSEEPEEPTFGDLLKANAPETVEVQDFPNEATHHSLMPAAGPMQPELPSGMSLSTVLTQALRTNDSNLLKNCFNVRELSVVRATIERLNSQHVPSLLEKLAQRLHSHPGRAGSLMVWVQWTLIAHGGYLASRPDVMKKLNTLQRIVQERSESLQPLLSLKGKLDMLEAQMNLRKSMQRRAQNTEADDDELVVYVEGEEDSDSDVASNASKPTAEEGQAIQDLPMDVDSGNEMPMVNGHISESEDVDSDENGYLDMEASSTDADSGDNESEIDVDHDDADTDTSEAEGVPSSERPVKPKVKRDP